MSLARIVAFAAKCFASGVSVSVEELTARKENVGTTMENGIAEVFCY